MNDRGSYRRHEELHEENPPYSRLFVVCSKSLTENELNKSFSVYGQIEKLHMPRDRESGNSKGIAYIKYSKTSEAALAIQEMCNKQLGPENKPVKVMIASNKDSESDINEDNYKRLFIVSKSATESELREYFSTFGKVESVHLQRDKLTEESKGFAYICFKTFLSAAIALEECDKKYKAIFAKPRGSLKRTRSCLESNYNSINECKNMRANTHREFYDQHYNTNNRNQMLKADPDNYTSVRVSCSLQLTRRHIERLFDVVPGMETCQYSIDGEVGKAIVKYSNHEAAAHAVQKLHNFEYPFGEKIVVIPEYDLFSKVADDLTNMVQTFKDAMNSPNPMTDLVSLANAMSQASSLLKSATNCVVGPNVGSFDGEDSSFCNVRLPPPQPLAEFHAPMAKRCFIICKPHPPSSAVLRDVFSRFGDLINVYILPNKTCGFVRYASVHAADEAIKTLNGATVTGVHLKVIEAENKKNDGCKSDDECKINPISKVGTE